MDLPQIRFHGLQGDRYIIRASSRYFPNIDVKEVINECLQIAYEYNKECCYSGVTTEIGF